MGEPLFVDELKEKLNFIGLDSIVFFSLQQKKDDKGEHTRIKVTDDITNIELIAAVDPIQRWNKSVGQFYEDKRGYEQVYDWRTKELRQLFGNNDVLSYFMMNDPGFRLSNDDNLSIVKSMVTYANAITKGGVQIQNIGNHPYDSSVLDEASRIMKKIKFEPYIIGSDECIFS